MASSSASMLAECRQHWCASLRDDPHRTQRLSVGVPQGRDGTKLTCRVERARRHGARSPSSSGRGYPLISRKSPASLPCGVRPTAQPCTPTHVPGSASWVIPNGSHLLTTVDSDEKHMKRSGPRWNAPSISGAVMADRRSWVVVSVQGDRTDRVALGRHCHDRDLLSREVPPAARQLAVELARTHSGSPSLALPKGPLDQSVHAAQPTA